MKIRKRNEKRNQIGLKFSLKKTENEKTGNKNRK